MPQYNWKNLKTGEELDVSRRMKDIDVPPTLEEAQEACVSPEGPWERQLSGGIKLRRTNAWGMGKGHWGGGVKNIDMRTKR